jgi:GNAT superfamily N-acetyltransferase
MFCSIALARRIEAAEARLTTDIGTAALTLAGAGEGLFVEPFAGGVAACGGVESPFTKIIGVGFDPLPLAGELDALERLYAEVGAAPAFEIATLADLELVRLLEARGYRLLRTETVLGRALAAEVASPSVPGDVAIARVDVEDDGTWLEVSIDGFAASEAPEGRDEAAEVYSRQAIERAARLFGHAPALRRYVARRGDEPAGAASMRVDSGVAQLCGAATRVDHRRHGIQTSLLYHRLADARAAGCDLAVVTTEPGSRSQANAQRHGFTPLYPRLVLGLDAQALT